MSRNRLNMVIAVVAMAVVAVAGFFIGVQPQLAQAASNREQQSTVEATNASTAKELARLRDRAKSLPEMQTELDALQRSVPSSASMSAFYSEIDGVASTSGVTVSAITTSDAVAYSPPASDTSSASDSTASAEASPTATASASASASPSTPSVTTNSAITSSNFSVIPVSVSVDGTFAQALSFVSGTRDGARLFLVNSITSSASQDSTDSAATASTTWTFSGYVYVLDTASDTATKG